MYFFFQNYIFLFLGGGGGKKHNFLQIGKLGIMNFFSSFSLKEKKILVSLTSYQNLFSLFIFLFSFEAKNLGVTDEPVWEQKSAMQWAPCTLTKYGNNYWFLNYITIFFEKVDFLQSILYFHSHKILLKLL